MERARRGSVIVNSTLQVPFYSISLVVRASVIGDYATRQTSRRGVTISLEQRIGRLEGDRQNGRPRRCPAYRPV